MGYRFRIGQFEGLTMKYALLRKAPDLYRLMAWARGKPNLFRAVAEFERLQSKLRNAPIVVRCGKAGCKRLATEMTLPLGYDGFFWPNADYWCGKHGPYEDEGSSPKLRIHFDVIDRFDKKKNRAAVHRAVLTALGIRRHRSSITEKFARTFFESLK